MYINAIDGASCVVLDDPILRNSDRNACNGMAYFQYAYDNDGLTHRISQIATHSLPRYTYKASHLQQIENKVNTLILLLAIG